MWLRSGDTSSANNFVAFLEDTSSNLKNKIVSLIRLVVAFSNQTSWIIWSKNRWMTSLLLSLHILLKELSKSAPIGLY